MSEYERQAQRELRRLDRAVSEQKARIRKLEKKWGDSKAVWNRYVQLISEEDPWEEYFTEKPTK